MPKLINLLNAQTAFSKLGSAPNAKLAYKARKIRRYILPEIEDYQETVNEYLKEHAPDGKSIDEKKNPEVFKAATEFFDGLVDEEVDVKWKPIPVSEVMDTDLSMYDFDLLIDAGVLVDPEEVEEETPPPAAEKKKDSPDAQEKTEAPQGDNK